MIELADASPEVNVDPAEYRRLLGYPRDLVLSGRACELADGAQAWYAKNGRPWTWARQAEGLDIAEPSSRLNLMFHQAEAHAAILAAVSAGPELEREAQRLWQEEKPDEYFFLEMLGSAVVEHLCTMMGARLCAWAETHGMAVLPHYSPGYPGWDIAGQPRLLALMRQVRDHPFPGEVEALESGALRPRKSLLAVFGLTRHTDRVRRLTDLVPCENCSFLPCQYRRTPYRRTLENCGGGTSLAPVLPAGATYGVNTKALRRWASERLSLEAREDGTTDALFRYEGTTCTNMGHPLTFLYKVKLGPRHAGYPIQEQHCGPAPGDAGHTSMCRYLDDRERLMAAIDRERPLLGRRLDEVLSWTRPFSAAGCYCEAASRDHKWGLVLETIHYALAHPETQTR